MLSIHKVNETLQVSFNYDPDIVEKIKTLKNRKYLTDLKVWEISQSEIKNLIELFGDDLLIDPDVDLDYVSPKYDFEPELIKIVSDQLRNFTRWALNQLPDYFYTVAASSTSKYHPSYALGDGGLVRHTTAAVMIANELFENHTIQSFDDEEKDIIRVALTLHDGLKHGRNGNPFVVATHPLDVVEYLEDIYYEIDESSLNEDVIEVMEDGLWQQIAECITSHMGEWNTDYRSKKEILPKPNDEMQKFVHLCDYLSSRKIIEINFNVDK